MYSMLALCLFKARACSLQAMVATTYAWLCACTTISFTPLCHCTIKVNAAMPTVLVYHKPSNHNNTDQLSQSRTPAGLLAAHVICACLQVYISPRQLPAGFHAGCIHSGCRAVETRSAALSGSRLFLKDSRHLSWCLMQCSSCLKCSTVKAYRCNSISCSNGLQGPTLDAHRHALRLAFKSCCYRTQGGCTLQWWCCSSMKARFLQHKLKYLP